jgi:hypothetical protein
MFKSDFFIPIKDNVPEWIARVARVLNYIISIIGLLFFNFDAIDVLWVFTVHLMAVSFVGLVKMVGANRNGDLEIWFIPRFLIGVFAFLFYTYPIIWLMNEVFHYNVVEKGANSYGWVKIWFIALGQFYLLIRWFTTKTYKERTFSFELLWHTCYFFGIYYGIKLGISYLETFELSVSEQKLAAVMVLVIRLFSDIFLEIVHRLLVKLFYGRKVKKV